MVVCPGGPNVITRVITSGRGQHLRKAERCRVRTRPSCCWLWRWNEGPKARMAGRLQWLQIARKGILSRASRRKAILPVLWI